MYVYVVICNLNTVSLGVEFENLVCVRRLLSFVLSSKVCEYMPDTTNKGIKNRVRYLCYLGLPEMLTNTFFKEGRKSAVNKGFIKNNIMHYVYFKEFIGWKSCFSAVHKKVALYCLVLQCTVFPVPF